MGGLGCVGMDVSRWMTGWLDRMGLGLRLVMGTGSGGETTCGLVAARACDAKGALSQLPVYWHDNQDHFLIC